MKKHSEEWFDWLVNSVEKFIEPEGSNDELFKKYGSQSVIYEMDGFRVLVRPIDEKMSFSDRSIAAKEVLRRELEKRLQL